MKYLFILLVFIGCSEVPKQEPPPTPFVPAKPLYKYGDKIVIDFGFYSTVCDYLVIRDYLSQGDNPILYTARASYKSYNRGCPSPQYITEDKILRKIK